MTCARQQPPLGDDAHLPPPAARAQDDVCPPREDTHSQVTHTRDDMCPPAARVGDDTQEMASACQSPVLGGWCAPTQKRQQDNAYKSIQESQETQISNHLDEVVAAVSLTPKEKIQNKLPQSALFRPPQEKLQLCEEKAKSYSSCHHYRQAIQELVRCVALTRICYGDCHWKLAEAYINLAQGYLQMKGLSLQAKQHTEKAKEVLASSIEPPYNDNTDVFKCSVDLFHTMGRAFIGLQKFKEASENLAKAERLSKELLQCGRIIKEEWMEIQEQLKLSLAHLYQGQKKFKEALPHYQEALECIESNKGKKSLECVPVLRELAGVEQALGIHDSCISHLLQAHFIILNKCSSQEEAADSAHLVAQAAVTSGRPEHHEVAEQYFQESMANLRGAEDMRRGKFLSIQDEFCHFLKRTGQEARALSLLKESLGAKVEAFGDFSPEVAATYRLLGKADLAEGNHSKARKKLKKCLQIQTLLYGAQDKRTLATQQTVDILSK
ncbi:PREDICTED: tetratricopeptide repeat protein 23-like [Elephantulus edwardii]|uniref:tetratricopeptide repeat protein 23-like n=1 Tax=Elephantulus edwardii TaxID=28737 RepID=UPI0003F0CC68|nr:PREDICTED: tetratricopeptide repeat protein 23-like [Elephantulus edwardii]